MFSEIHSNTNSQQLLNDTCIMKDDQKINDMDVNCICNGILIACKAREIHGGDIACDECNVLGRDNMNAIFWHCPKEETDAHRYGYDVCDNCYLQKGLHEYNIGKQQELRYSHQNKLHQKEKCIEVQCICNGVLSKLKVSDLNLNEYNERRIICNICGVRGLYEAIFWHCKEEINIHPDINGIAGISTFNRFMENGYNICNQCYLKKEQDCIDNTQYQQINICENELECDHINNFVKIIKTYNDNMDDMTQNMDRKKLQNVLDDYLHLIHDHDKDNQFEFILEKLGPCDIQQCIIFRRNNRNRINMDMIKQYTETMNVYQSIMDKMHCYFQHCQDIGNRLSVKEKESMQDIGDNKYDDMVNIDEDIESIVNDKIIKMRNILKEKRKIYEKCNDISLRQNALNKFSQLDQEDDMMNTDKYNHGILFKYGYIGEKNGDKKAFAKYDCLKTELLNNKIFVLNKKQFNLEYEKAEIHFNSFYCKESFKPYIIKHQKQFPPDSKIGPNEIIGDIEFECILVLMVYCNYTDLQSEFSKTYRMDEGKKHTEIYWFGKYLKIAVHKFGTNVCFGSINKFYHGITKPLLFPSYINSGSALQLLYCPLSTTVSIEVATNFALLNKGLVVQFEGGSNSYFSTEWLSDYGNEKEYLFVQNRSDLNMQNIINTRNGIHYEPIFNALKVINEMIWPPRGNPKNEQITDLGVITLIKCIISHQLSYKLPNYSSFKSLQEYGKRMLNIFFQNRTDLDIDDKKWKQQFPFLLDLLYHSDAKLINIESLNALFPNLSSIEFINMNLSISLLTDILNQINNKKTSSKIRTVTIERSADSDLSLMDALKQYTALYRAANFFIYIKKAGVLSSRKIRECLQISNKYKNIFEFGVSVIASMGNMDIYDINNEVTYLIDKLISNECKSQESYNEDIDNYQSEFHQWCTDKTRIMVNWENIVSNSNPKIFQRFYDLSNKWIHFDILMKLYPNLRMIYLETIPISDASILNVWMILCNKKNICSVNKVIIKFKLGDGRDSKSKCGEADSNGMTLIKQLLNCDKDNEINIYDHDWNSFDKLYQVKKQLEQHDMIKTQQREIKYHLNTLITTYAVHKYKQKFQEIGYNMYVELENYGDLLIIAASQ